MVFKLKKLSDVHGDDEYITVQSMTFKYKDTEFDDDAYLEYINEKDVKCDIRPWELDLDDNGTMRNIVSLLGQNTAEKIYDAFVVYWGA